MTTESLADFTDRIIPDILSRKAETVGDSLFLMQDDRRLTYLQTSTLADSHAQAYASLSIGKGDTVAMFMDNSIEMAATTFGINRLGAIWSPISTEYRGEWLASLLRKVGSKVLVVDGPLLHNVTELGDLGFEHFIVNGAFDGPVPAGVTVHNFADFSSFDAIRPNLSPSYSDTNAILWTSGTTGPSKGVEQSHNAWITFSLQHNNCFRNGVYEDERFYGCVPMYNSGGWISNIYPALISGSVAAIDPRFSVTNYWDRVRFYGANHTMVLGTMPVFLLQQPPKEDDADNPLRTAIFNPPIPGLVEQFMKRFDIETIGSGFGQSEIMGATLWASYMDTKPGSQGFVNLDEAPIETRILGENDVEVGPGEVGEICVRPREPYTIFNGYFKEPERTLEACSNLWYHSGDLGKVDSDGELYFVDRKKDSTRHKGRNISSFEVEHIVRQHPHVLNVAAVGIPSEHLEFEEELLLSVLLVPGATFDPLDLCKFIDDKAPYFFVPRYVDVVTEFPMTPTSKIQKFKIREAGLPAGAWDRERDAPEWSPTQKRPASATS